MTLHHRRTIRLSGWDYSADGTYFVTVCTNRRVRLFGDIVDGQMHLNAVGSIVAETWRWLQAQYAYVELDEWCVMPNHLHGILTTTGSGGARSTPTAGIAPAGDAAINEPALVVETRRKPLGRLIGTFKTVSTKHINQLCNTSTRVVWQRNFWDRVIRDDVEMDRIREYIRNNPVSWASDELNRGQ